MASRREGPFPVVGELVTASDGTTWVFTVAPGGWEHVGDCEPLVELENRERDQRARLLLALRVWERAAAACSFIRVPGPDVRATDPLPTFVEMLARAALTDCIAETCDGAPLGMLHHTIKQVEGLLNPSSHRRVLTMLTRHLAAARTLLLSAPIAGGAHP